MNNVMQRYGTIIALIAIITSLFVVFAYGTEFDIGTEENPYEGLPNATIIVSNLDNSGNLIYCGIDAAVFWDPEKDGTFAVYPIGNKVKRIITTSKNITLNLGSISDYQKGIKYKLGMRTLYVPTGTKQEPIIIAGESNGKSGWVEVPDSCFQPTYFVQNNGGIQLIDHTIEWNDNRVAYNLEKQSHGLAGDIREEKVFWSGEAFIIRPVLQECTSFGGIHTYIKYKNEDGSVDNRKLDEDGNVYEATYTNWRSTDAGFSDAFKTANPGVLEYTENKPGAIGFKLYNDDFIDKWGNTIPEDLSIVIEILDKTDGSILDTKEYSITVDNRELYYRTYREY